MDRFGPVFIHSKRACPGWRSDNILLPPPPPPLPPSSCDRLPGALILSGILPRPVAAAPRGRGVGRCLLGHLRQENRELAPIWIGESLFVVASLSTVLSSDYLRLQVSPCGGVSRFVGGGLLRLMSFSAFVILRVFTGLHPMLLRAHLGTAYLFIWKSALISSSLG